MENPLVSVIIPTYNSSKFLDACLSSIKDQTYKNIEILVVDNNSADNTKEIARKYTDKVFNKGPERSAQRNFGVKQSSGEFVLIIDSDMKLSSEVVSACALEIQETSETKALIIPEESSGEGFWAKCKKLERSFYVGVDWMEAARFFRKEVYQSLGGYDENLVSGEDWDLSQRVKKTSTIGRIDPFIYHHEGKPTLIKILRKKYYYAQLLKRYTQKRENKQEAGNQTSILKRYQLFFSKPEKFFQNPIVWIGMIFMKTCEFGFGAVGYIIS